MRAEVRRALEFALPKHLDWRRAHEAWLAAPAVDPIPHPRLELQVLGESHRHPVLETAVLHQRNQLGEQRLEL